MSWQDTLISSHTTTWSTLIPSSVERRWRRNSATFFLSFLVCILLPFTALHYSPSTCFFVVLNTKEDILRNVGNQTVESESDMTYDQVYGDPYSEFVFCIYPILSAHTQQWTHTHREHTPEAVGSHLCCGARGAVGGSVPCSRAPQYEKKSMESMATVNCLVTNIPFSIFGWPIPLSKKKNLPVLELHSFLILLYSRYDRQPRHSGQQLYAISHREATSVQQLIQSSHWGYAHRLQATHWPCKCVCVCVCERLKKDPLCI